MKQIQLDEAAIPAILLGGAILGGGGGGEMARGEMLARLAWEKGFRAIIPCDAVPQEALLVTVSLVGAPSAGSAGVAPEQYVRAVELLGERAGLTIGGLISSEVGAVGVVNGWHQSAALGLPLVDAPCNGRAHPLGLMGSMGLHRDPNHVSRQAAVGGGAGHGAYVEHYIEGPIETVAGRVLQAAVAAGGMVAVARNPVSARYAQIHGAPGALRMALALGRAALRGKERGGADAMAREILEFFGDGRSIQATIGRRILKTIEGLDLGRIDLDTENGPLALTFWNEFMTLEQGTQRLAEFPDLMTFMDRETCLPVSSAEAREGQKAILLTVPAERLILGAGVRDPELLRRKDETLKRFHDSLCPE